MADTPEPPDARVRRVTFTLSFDDIARLRRVTARRHPNDPRSLSLTVRELIREEDERGLRQEGKGK